MWGRFFFGLVVDTNYEKDLVALGELERLWKRKKERKREKERDIISTKKKGRNFLSLSLSRAREKKHVFHGRPIKKSRERKKEEKRHIVGGSRFFFFCFSRHTLKRKHPLCFGIL